MAIVDRQYAALRIGYCPELRASHLVSAEHERNEASEAPTTRPPPPPPPLPPLGITAAISAYVVRIVGYTINFPAVLWLCCIVTALFYACEAPFKGISAYGSPALPLVPRGGGKRELTLTRTMCSGFLRAKWGYTTTEAGQLASVIILCTIIGSPLVGLLVDRVGKRPLIGTCSPRLVSHKFATGC